MSRNLSGTGHIWGATTLSPNCDDRYVIARTSRCVSLPGGRGPARAWEPKRLRLRLFSAAGRLVRGGHRLRLRIAATWPWASHLTTAMTWLHAYAPG